MRDSLPARLIDEGSTGAYGYDIVPLSLKCFRTNHTSIHFPGNVYLYSCTEGDRRVGLTQFLGFASQTTWIEGCGSRSSLTSFSSTETTAISFPQTRTQQTHQLEENQQGSGGCGM